MSLLSTRARVVPWAVAGSVVRRLVCTTRLCKYDVGELVEVVVCVWIIEAFAKSVDEDTWVRILQLDAWIGSILVINRQEDFTDGVLSLCWLLLETGRWHFVFLMRVQQMVADNEHACRYGHCNVNTIFDAGKDCNQNTNEEYDDLKW